MVKRIVYLTCLNSSISVNVSSLYLLLDDIRGTLSLHPLYRRLMLRFNHGSVGHQL